MNITTQRVEVPSPHAFASHGRSPFPSAPGMVQQGFTGGRGRWLLGEHVLSCEMLRWLFHSCLSSKSIA
jgi:hypothetical protein